MVISFSRAFHDADFVVGQAIQFIHEAVDLRVNGGDLAFERGLFLRRPRRGKLAVRGQRLLYQLRHFFGAGGAGLGFGCP